jgi:hypothetical protein
VSTAIAALARSTDAPNEEASFVPVEIVDLSETGAKIASDSKLGEVGAVLHVKFQVEVSGVVEEMGLLAEVRNVAERTEAGLEGDKSVVYSGVQFRTLSRYQQILLHAWVTNQVLQSALRSQRS